jgi:hypothetical protein
MDAADRINQVNQAVIGAKEGITDGIIAVVGKLVTDTVLRTADGTDDKAIDDYEIHDLLDAVAQAAERPRHRDVRKQLVAAVDFSFNFQRHFSANAVELRTKIAKLLPFGIELQEDIIAAIILAEAETAALKSWGREISTAMDEIRKQYGYNFRHNATSVTRIMKELAMADAVRNFSDAPAPSTEMKGYAEAVDQVASHVRQLCFDDDTSEEGTAAAADGYSSDSSGETRSSRASKKTKSRGRSSSRRSGKARKNDYTAENNPCKYCKKHGRINRHPSVPSEKCFFRKSWKGFRPRYACKILDVRFKPKENFSSEMGGYASSDGDTSDEE